MTARTERLRRDSLDAIPSISGERAAITTAFYKAQMGRHSIPVLRAMNFYAICDGKTLWMGDGELIVGERGPRPKAVPTYPELTCHSAEDLRILDSRPKTQYKVDPCGHRGVRARDHPVLARPLAARPDVRRAAAGLARCLRGRLLHRVHGAARARPHGGRRQALPQGDARLQGRHRQSRGGPRFRARPGSARQARAAAGHVDRLRRGHPLRRAPRRTGGGRGRAGARRHPPRGTAEDRRRLPPGARPRAARLPRGAADVLVLPPRRHHRAQRLGRLQPGPPRPAPLAVLRGGPRRRHAHARIGARAARVLLHQVQQPHRAAQGRRHRGRERHLHRLRQHQPRRPAARRQRRLERGDAPPARHHRRDAPAAAEQQRAGVAQDARRGAEARAARHPQRLRLPVALQRRRGRRGAAPPGQDARGRARGRLLGLRRGGRVRQGSLHPHRATST